MSKIAIVTDSTAYIPEEVTEELPVSIVPLEVIWGLDVYKDGIDIQPDEFYLKLSQAKTMPTTSQPSPAMFIDTYAKLIGEGYDIISIHISSDLSGTVASALQAKEHFPGSLIEVIDSRTTSMAMGLPILNSARAAKNGLDFQSCVDIAQNAVAHSGILFAVNTLEFLHRGGRIGGASAFLGNVLDLKPILEVRDGKIEAVEKVRSSGKAIERLLDLVEMKIPQNKKCEFAIIHANVPDEARQLQQRVGERFNISSLKNIICADTSPVIGTHTGPGTLGIAYQYHN